MNFHCDLQFDNRNGIYQPGQILSGRVFLSIHERLSLKAFALKITGYASTNWRKEITAKQQKKHEKKNQKAAVKNKHQMGIQVNYYEYRQDYISTTNYFIGSTEASPKLLEIGNYTYTFAVRLPEHCAASYESEFGRVRYDINLFIDYPDRQHICLERMIIVKRELDLRSDNALIVPYDIEIIEQISFIKFWQQPLQIQCNIPQRGYVPGENIAINVKIVNYNRLLLNELIYKLNMITTYTGYLKKKSQVKVEQINLLKNVHSMFGQSGTIAQHLDVLYIPDTVASTSVTECKCIQIAYEVEVIVCTSDRKRTLNVRMPIKIGSISLRHREYRDFDNEKSMSAARSMDNLSVIQVETPSNDDYPSAPPMEASTSLAARQMSASMNNLTTSYQEANFMTAKNFNKGEKGTMSGDNKFKPKYLYYNLEEELRQENIEPTAPSLLKTHLTKFEDTNF